ncbi:MAG: acetyl-CoA carboxylase, carboxyltransferase subunit beta [Calditrichia bacterium]
MDWFRKKKGISTVEKKAIPDGLWIKCDDCGEIIYRSQLQSRLYVCPKCDYHFRVSSRDYIQFLFDEESFSEFNEHIAPGDPLLFKEKKKYSDRLKDAQKKSGLLDAVITGDGKIKTRPVVAAIMDFTFIGGSMGSVVGEKISRAIDHAREKRFPLLIVSASGGARMMEAALSLMQMAKTSAKLSQLSDAGLPYFSILTDPTTGGTTASFAMLGDINIAEPGALIGFAGQRVIKQTIGQDLPQGFQRAEFLQNHGFVDMIVHRKDMRDCLANLMDLLLPEKSVSKNSGKKNSKPTAKQ